MQRGAVAIIVGIERYRDVKLPATGAQSDAERFAQVAQQTLGIPSERIKLLTGDRATRADIERGLAWAKLNATARARTYFFFSGHGAPDPSAGTPYLVPYDGHPDALSATAIPLKRVIEVLRQSAAAHAFVMVDSCFSGEGGRSILPPGIRPLVRVQAPPTSASIAVFTGATGAQISGPAPGGKGGLFTSVLIEVLGTGKADGDGDVSISELAQRVTPRVERAARADGREQKPSLVLGASLPEDTPVATGVGAQPLVPDAPCLVMQPLSDGSFSSRPLSGCARAAPVVLGSGRQTSPCRAATSGSPRGSPGTRLRSDHPLPPPNPCESVHRAIGFLLTQALPGALGDRPSIRRSGRIWLRRNLPLLAVYRSC